MADERIYDLQPELQPFLTDEVALDRRGNSRARRLTLKKIGELLKSQAATGPSGYIPVTGNVLPNVTDKPAGYTLVGKGSYTFNGQTITTTELLNELGWNGTTWLFVRSLDTSGLAGKDELQYYGTFDSLALAIAGVPLAQRKLGDTVGVKENGSIVEYWWKTLLTDVGLILKSTPMTSVINPLDTLKAVNGKAVSDFTKDNFPSYSKIELNLAEKRSVILDTYVYQNTSKLSTPTIVYQSQVAATPVDTLVFTETFLRTDIIKISFTEINRDRVFFVNNDNAILGSRSITTEEVINGFLYSTVPDGTRKLIFGIKRSLIAGLRITILRKDSPLDIDKYSYLAYSNILNRSLVEFSKVLNVNGEMVSAGATVYTTPYLPVFEGKVILYGVNIQASSGVFFYDVNKQLISKVLRADLTYNVLPESNTWDMKLIIPAPVGTRYMRYSNDKGYYSGLNRDDIYSTSIEFANVYQDFNVLTSSIPAVLKPSRIDNNIQTQKNTVGFLADGSDLKSTSKKVNIINTAATGVGRVAFRFKLNEDVNRDNSEKKLVEFISKDGLSFFNFVINRAVTTPLIGEDYPGRGTLTTYPIPQFNSGFGIRTNIEAVAENRRNYNYEKRALNTPDKTLNYKPLCGGNLFYIRLKTGEITASQDLCIQWSDLRLETTATQIKLSSVKNGLSIISVYGNFETLRDLFFDFKAKIEASVIGPNIELTSVTLGGRKPQASLVSRYSGFGLWGDPSDILIMNVPLVSPYYNVKANKELLESYPAYVMKGKDDSWHTFEFISCQNKNNAVFTIDGQWIRTEGDYSYDGIRKAFESGGLIKIGNESAIDIKDLTVEFDQYTGVELRDTAPTASYFLSEMHPHIIHYYGHDVYYCEDQNITLEEDSAKYHSYVSEGGFIPDSLKNPNPDYRGDDSIQAVRKNLAHPSWKLEMLLKWATEAGYTCISNKELADFQRMGTPLPSNKCYLIGFDDLPTYMWKIKELRRIFRRYGARPYFALELGWYVDSSMTSNLYNIPTHITNSKDTDAHRFELQKRVRTMALEGWDVVLHGAKEGFYHRGVSFNDMLENIEDTFNLAEQLGFNSQYWCIAANGFTPNQIKLHDVLGILTSSSTKDTYCSLCHHPNYTPRTGWETTISSSDYYLKAGLFSY